MTKEEFLNKAVKVHGNKYDYSLVPNVVKGSDKIKLICNETHPWGEPHGVFEVQAQKHLYRGDGCTKCSGKYKRTKEDFVKEATYVHKGIYAYDNFEYKNTATKGIIHCTIHDIDFEMDPDHHLRGQGCPKCRYEKSSQNNTKTTEEFISYAQSIHKNKYDYSKVDYKRGNEKVRIVCPEHGEFWMTPNNHTHKTNPQGCPKCGRIKCDSKRRLNTDEFIRRAKRVYGNRFDYSKVKYISSTTPIEIICNKHGSFMQIPANHLIGESCPKCGCGRSKGEKEVSEFIQSLGFNIQTNNRSILDGDEIDIVIPDKNLCIEYNGLHWHSEFNKPNDYHLNKTEQCLSKGYQLIHIFEDEWLYKQEIVKSRLSHILGCCNNSIYARKCIIKTVNSTVATKFLEENHMQGKCGSQVKLGLYYKGDLVSLMTFGKSRHFIGNGKCEWELLRFANKMGVNVIGGASKLLKHFIREFKPTEIISYADRRWSLGKLYETLGFKLYNKSNPNYFYVIGQKRKYRFGFRKSMLIKEGYDSNKSEHQIMLDRGIYRIYDCGCLCYKWCNSQPPLPKG